MIVDRAQGYRGGSRSSLTGRMLLAVVPALSASAHAQDVSLVDLGAGVTAYGINSSGQVTGCFPSHGAAHAFLYTAGTMTDLGTLGGNNSCGYALNASGQVTGYAETGSGAAHAFLYRGGTITDLGTIAGQPTSTGLSINSGGAVVGYAWAGSPMPPVDLFAVARQANATITPLTFGFLYENGTITELQPVEPAGANPSLVLSGINDAGVISGARSGGCTFTCPNGAPLTLTNGLESDLAQGDMFFTATTGINNSNAVVGYGEDPLAFMHGAIFINGQLTELGRNTVLFAINAGGQAVGLADIPRAIPEYTGPTSEAGAFVYANGNMTALNIPGT